MKGAVVAYFNIAFKILPKAATENHILFNLG